MFCSKYTLGFEFFYSLIFYILFTICYPLHYCELWVTNIPCIIKTTSWVFFKFLSSVGRLILVRHVLSSIPLHISLVLSLPSKTCLLIERMMRNFMWSPNLEKKKSNLVRWKTVHLPKEEVGLGLRRVKEFNEVCLLKLAWSVISTDSL